MINPLTITNNDPAGVVIGNPEYRDELLKFPGNDTYVAGTILARDPADNTLVVCDPTESDGTEIPSAILTIEEINTAGATNVSIRALISGKVRLEKLVFDNGDQVETWAIEALRAFGIIALAAPDMAQLDNQ